MAPRPDSDFHFKSAKRERELLAHCLSRYSGKNEAEIFAQEEGADFSLSQMPLIKPEAVGADVLSGAADGAVFRD